MLIESDRESEEQSVAKIITTLEALGFIPRVPGTEYSPAEEEAIKSRLKDLGYI